MSSPGVSRTDIIVKGLGAAMTMLNNVGKFSVSLIDNSRRLGLVEEEFIDSSLRLICCEEIDGRKWKYVAENDGFGRYKKNSIRAVSLQTPQAPVEEIMSFIRTYVVPEGFPDSVTPSYVPYMTWRALKHFFGGAMGVFTTKTLLSSVGVSKSKAIPGAVAINGFSSMKASHDLYNLQHAFNCGMFLDGAGRVGKMLFARQGKKFDCDLKQLGTGLSIMIAKRNPSLVTTFALLSCGYVFSSPRGKVPSLQEGNMKENIFSFPWLKERPIVLGPRFKDAFQDPSAYLAIKPLFEQERYIVTYNPLKDKVYALLKDQAKSDDILKAAFHARVLLHFINSSNNIHSSSWKQQAYRSNYIPSANDIEAHITDSCKMVSTLYGPFKSKAAEQGWRMSDSLLNPGRARIVVAC
ncbi:hypothetical protein GH714_007222 [Hevea brasiliensis]|uniref:Uncharacterized protein n=1 Tax=Hevea brasiliensis TaxID=3981 RepID=A0A6A6L186_HEVBR|nr:hypothetical protein GH714_007222 [Hevea brasiliensis]